MEMQCLENTIQKNNTYIRLSYFTEGNKSTVTESRKIKLIQKFT